MTSGRYTKDQTKKENKMSDIDKTGDALKFFEDYFRNNYPGPDTIIFNPDWHAPKIFRAAIHALTASGLSIIPTEELEELQGKAQVYDTQKAVEMARVASIVDRSLRHLPSTERER